MSGRIYDRPVGYLPAYELSRLHSGHGAQLRSAKFGPSALDGDVPVYLESSALALVQALIGAQRAINSMKAEAETAAQGDEQMMLDACEQIFGTRQPRRAESSEPRATGTSAGMDSNHQVRRPHQQHQQHCEARSQVRRDVPRGETGSYGCDGQGRSAVARIGIRAKRSSDYWRSKWMI